MSTQDIARDDRMAGQVALVTGASRGIGRAIALALAARGMRVVGTATTDAGAAAIGDVAGLALGPRHRPRRHRRRRARRRGRRHRQAATAALHVLVNNAGITRDTLPMRMKDDDWDAVLDTNLKAVFRAAARRSAR